MDLSFFCDRIDDLIKAAEKRGSACTGFLDSSIRNTLPIT